MIDASCCRTTSRCGWEICAGRRSVRDWLSRQFASWRVISHRPFASEEARARTIFLSLLLDATDEDDAMSEEELYAQCVMLLFGGHETTRNLIGNGIYTLLKHPEAYGQLLDDESLLPAAIEELLRYESPVQAFGRVVKTDLELHGTQLPAGSVITFMIGAAHRDSRQYSDPDRLDLRRPHNRHLAFGGDAHVCLGSTLARLEGRLSIRALTRRFPSMRLVDEAA